MKKYRRDGDIGSLLIIINTVRVKKVLKFQATKALCHIFMVFCCNVLLNLEGVKHAFEGEIKN